MNFFTILLFSFMINMTGNGFEPRETTVEKNTTVTFVNKDSVDRWPASNIHPTHGIYLEFDPKRPVKPGEEWKFKFNKIGQWKFHDHLLPHMRGTITVIGEKDNSSGLMSKIIGFFQKIKHVIVRIFSKEKGEFAFLEDMMASRGVEAAWKYVADHDGAHYVGSRIFEKKGIAGISICDPSFAFGCYHGFSEAAFKEIKNQKSKIKNQTMVLANACKSVGKVGSGPWASCIHGIGHGVATYFDTVDLKNALLACDNLSSGANYCHDGVFMEFATNAPKSFYKENDPLYPCNSLDEKYKQGCARNQTRVMAKFLAMNFSQIINVCLGSQDPTIHYHCIDSIGLAVGQRSEGRVENIVSDCGEILPMPERSQCVAAAAGELVFQNFKGWETESFEACVTLPMEFQKSCNERVKQVITSYQR